MSWKVCSYIFSFTKLFKEIVIYSYYPNNHRLNEIVQSIQGCGCTMIKLTQWLIPIIQVNGPEQVLENQNMIYIEYNVNSDIEYFKKTLGKEIYSII